MLAVIDGFEETGYRQELSKRKLEDVVVHEDVLANEVIDLASHGRRATHLQSPISTGA
jgi:hypothetical protein